MLTSLFGDVVHRILTGDFGVTNVTTQLCIENLSKKFAYQVIEIHLGSPNASVSPTVIQQVPYNFLRSLARL